MDSVLQQAFLILEQRTVVSLQFATEVYKQCCSVLELTPTPLQVPDAEPEEPP